MSGYVMQPMGPSEIEWAANTIVPPDHVVELFIIVMENSHYLTSIPGQVE